MTQKYTTKQLRLINRLITISFQDNGRHHVAKITFEKLQEFDMEVFIQLQYPTDLAPMDYQFL